MRGPTALLASVAAVAIVLSASSAPAQAPLAVPRPPPGPPTAAPPQASLGLPGFMLPSQITLSFPGPPAPTPEQLRTIALLDQAEQEDSGRRLTWLWVDVDGGFEQMGMQTFNGGNAGFVAGFVNTSASGGAVGAGIGAHLLFFTILLRGRIGVFDSGQLYRVGPELGFHVPLGRVEPHLALGLGYAAVGHLHDNANDGGVAAADINLRGFYTRVGAGLDYYLAPVFSLGVDVSADLLGLSRPALTAAEVQIIKTTPGVDAAHQSSAGLLLAPGTGWGGTLAITGQAGLHF